MMTLKAESGLLFGGTIGIENLIGAVVAASRGILYFLRGRHQRGARTPRWVRGKVGLAGERLYLFKSR